MFLIGLSHLGGAKPLTQSITLVDATDVRNRIKFISFYISPNTHFRVIVRSIKNLLTKIKRLGS